MTSNNKEKDIDDSPLMGRPPKEFDTTVFEKLCQLNCTKTEISAFFNMGLTTLSQKCQDNYGQTFRGAYKVFSAGGRMALRRLQYKTAEAGSVTMQIWLGKQYLDQADKATLDHTVKDYILTPPSKPNED